MRHFFKLIIGIISFGVLLNLPAHAATFSLDFSDPLLVLPLPIAGTTTGTVHEGLTNSDAVGFTYTSPWEDTPFPGGEYTSVQALSSASYVFGESYSEVSFLWGSVDHYNEVLFKNSGVLVDILGGQLVIDAGVPADEMSVSITILAMAAFDTIIFKSSQNAFEYSNLAVSAIPLPATLPLYGAGLMVLGFLGRRRLTGEERLLGE
ncbi:MAG: hypothetical protein JKY04_05530 [Sneathiella sp.]|nr:hypothetical protein [Sneathiella sp.]